MQNETIMLENVNLLSNAIELATKTVLATAGNDIANTINGEQIAPSDLRASIAARIQKNIKSKG